MTRSGPTRSGTLADRALLLLQRRGTLYGCRHLEDEDVTRALAEAFPDAGPEERASALAELRAMLAVADELGKQALWGAGATDLDDRLRQRLPGHPVEVYHALSEHGRPR